MNEAIRDSIEVLFSTCVEMSEQGVAHAWVSSSPWGDINVRVYPAGSTYLDLTNYPALLISEDIHTREPGALDAIHDLIDKLNAMRTEKAA